MAAGHYAFDHRKLLTSEGLVSEVLEDAGRLHGGKQGMRVRLIKAVVCHYWPTLDCTHFDRHTPVDAVLTPKAQPVCLLTAGPEPLPDFFKPSLDVAPISDASMAKDRSHFNRPLQIVFMPSRH